MIDCCLLFVVRWSRFVVGCLVVGWLVDGLSVFVVCLLLSDV